MWSAPTQSVRDEETAAQALEPAATLNGNGSHAEVDRTVEREDSPAELAAKRVAGERARLQAEQRAARAEEDAAALRATLAVVASVAEMTIEASAQLVDEARRFARALAESADQAHGSTAEVPLSDAQRVITEARAAVAQLRADLLEDLTDDAQEGEIDPAAGTTATTGSAHEAPAPDSVSPPSAEGPV